MEDGAVDCIVTDPPYGEKQASWDYAKPPDALWDELYRVLKPGGTLYYWGFWGHAPWVLGNAERVGFTSLSRIVWWFRTGRPESKAYREDTEEAWYFGKGEPTTFNADVALEPYEDHSNYERYGREGKHPGTVWRASRIFHNHPENCGHPTQKPLDLIQRMIEVSTNPGDLVFDPYAGSATTAVVCIKTGRRFIGCEIDPAYHAIATRRLEDAQAQPMLFALA